ALNDILIIGACVALASAVLSYALIRRRDFVLPPQPAPQDSGQGNENAAATLAADARSSERG
ncbi:MAG: hypothetical protein ACRDP7_02750, partial [Trebonia sp.]